MDLCIDLASTFVASDISYHVEVRRKGMRPTLLSRIHRSLLGLPSLAGSWQQLAHLNFQLRLKQWRAKLSNFYWNNDKHLGPFRIEWQLLVSVTLQDAQARIPCCFGTIKKA
jgi:hypothetical protein